MYSSLFVLFAAGHYAIRFEDKHIYSCVRAVRELRLFFLIFLFFFSHLCDVSHILISSWYVKDPVPRNTVTCK